MEGWFEPLPLLLLLEHAYSHRAFGNEDSKLFFVKRAYCDDYEIITSYYCSEVIALPLGFRRHPSENYLLNTHDYNNSFVYGVT